jgi:hypothetical protein
VIRFPHRMNVINLNVVLTFKTTSLNQRDQSESYFNVDSVEIFSGSVY